MPRATALTRGIKDVFYETRVLMGRKFTLRRFAEEVLGGTLDAVTLSCIENGTRFPTEATVRRLAAVRKEDPSQLLVLLWRDRMARAFGRELAKALEAPRGVTGIEDAELAVLVAKAIAALPTDGSPMRLAAWRKAYASPPERTGLRRGEGPAAKQIESLLTGRGLVEISGTSVRRKGRHFVARGKEEQQSLVLEFFALFAKSVLDKLILTEADTGTYLRNHYLDIDPERIDEFRLELQKALDALTKKYAVDPAAGTQFLSVLVAATSI